MNEENKVSNVIRVVKTETVYSERTTGQKELDLKIKEALKIRASEKGKERYNYNKEVKVVIDNFDFSSNAGRVEVLGYCSVCDKPVFDTEDTVNTTAANTEDVYHVACEIEAQSNKEENISLCADKSGIVPCREASK